MTTPAPAAALIERIDALLPQTQCRQCGYDGCRPYAEAISNGAAEINRCPPGGNEVIADLAGLLRRPPVPLDQHYGETKAPAVALIDEAWCIGCTLCIQACPVDAIAGAAKLMHTVIVDECTGCELCIPPCPVDCIEMVAVARPNDRESRVSRAAQARIRYLARDERLGVHHAQCEQRPNEIVFGTAEHNKRTAVERALQRARQRINK